MDAQLAYLVKERTYSGATGVAYIDLPSNEQISMIMIEATATGTGTPDHDQSILDQITNVQLLLEGSKTAFSVKPEVASFMAFMTTGFQPPHDIDQSAGSEVMRLPIYFGRYPFDPEYMLDTGPYANAQLQIEWTLDGTDYTSGTFQLTVWFLRPVTKMSPRGFLRSRIVNTYSADSSAEEKEVDLPTGLPWYDVGFRIYDIDGYWLTNLTDVDFNIDEGRLHLFDGRSEDLLMLNQLWFGTDIEGPIVFGYHSHSDEMYTFLGKQRLITMMHFVGAPDILGVNSWAGRHMNLSIQDDAGSQQTADQAILYRGIGQLPYSCALVGKFWDKPFDAPRHADAKIVYQLGATALTLETFVREIVSGVL